MTKPRGALRAWLLAAALAMRTTAAMSLPPSTIFARDDTCGDTTYTKCPQAGFPDNFCCKPGTSCISLAGNTTVLCCPNGGDCAVIAPIVCNIQLQDATAYPQAVVKTTALTGELPTCGSNCCPFGYTCDGSQNCVKEQDQSKKPDSASQPSSTTSTPTSTPTTSSSTRSSDAGTTVTAAPGGGAAGAITEAHSEGANTSAIVGGVVGGVLLLIAAIIAVIYLMYRRRKERERKRVSNQSFVSKGAIGTISAPLPQKGFPYGRTDFIAKSNPSAHSTPSQAQEAFEGGKSYHSRDSYNSYDSAEERRSIGAGYDKRSLHASAIVPGLKTEGRGDADGTSPRQSGRRLGDGDDYEEINISFDPHTVPDFTVGGRTNQRDTTMTQWPSMQPGPGGRR